MEHNWPADKVERRPVASLVPNARNARTHSKEQVTQIAASIREWGWTTPVLIDEAGGLIAGHGRVLAASELGLAEIPVMVAVGWSTAQKEAYALADNKLALNAGWDDALLRIGLESLQALNFDIGLTGFSLGEVTGILSGGGALGGVTGAGSLAAKFGVPPFSVLNAREGWWQDRKAAWLSLGIQSELGRGEGSLDDSEKTAPNAAPGGSARQMDREEFKTGRYVGSRDRDASVGSKMPAADYSKRQRGDGRGKPVS